MTILDPRPFPASLQIVQNLVDEMEVNKADSGRAASATDPDVRFGISNNVTAEKLDRLEAAKTAYNSRKTLGQVQDKVTLDAEVNRFKTLDSAGKIKELEELRNMKKEQFEKEIDGMSSARRLTTEKKFADESAQLDLEAQKDPTALFEKLKRKPQWAANLRKAGTLERNVMGLGASAVCAQSTLPRVAR